MTIESRWPVWVLAIALAGCGGDASDHGNEHNAGGGHGHDDEVATEVVTRFNAETELFLEYPPLVAGESSRFAAHLTRLNDFRPVTLGRLTVTLSTGNRTAARFVVDAPARPGIFTPIVQPRETGEFVLRLVWKSAEMNSTHDLGTVTVHRTREAAERALQPGPEGEIAYLKEQQWTVDFSTVAVEPRRLRGSLPVMAQVELAPDALARMDAPGDGIVMIAEGVRSGARVERGGLLAEVYPRLAVDRDLADLMAANTRAKAELELAQTTFRRIHELSAQGAVPKARLEEADKALKVAESEAAVAGQRLTQAREGLGATESGVQLRSPIAGEVLEMHVAQGSYVTQGDPVIVVGDPQRLWLRALVPEHQAARAGDGHGLWWNDSEGVAYAAAAGAIERLGMVRKVDARTRTVSVLFPSDQDRSLIPGQRFPANLWTDEVVEGLAVPFAAVVDDGGQPVVYEMISGESFARRPIETGVRDGDWIEVRSGLKSGARIVSTGAYWVRLAASSPAEAGHGHAH